METNTNICTTKPIEVWHKFNENQQTKILNAVHDFLLWHGNAYETQHVLSDMYTTYLEQSFEDNGMDDGKEAMSPMFFSHFEEVTNAYRMMKDLCLEIDRATREADILR